MRATHLAQMDCSIARTVEIIGDRWTMMIVRSLFEFTGLHRFNDLRAELGIATNTLADRLESLTAHGIVERRPYSARPPRYEYHLTAAGIDLFPVVLALLHWGDVHRPAPGGPPVRLRHTECGHDTVPLPVCDHCRRPIDARTVTGHRALGPHSGA